MKKITVTRQERGKVKAFRHKLTNEIVLEGEHRQAYCLPLQGDRTVYRTYGDIGFFRNNSSYEPLYEGDVITITL